MNRPADERGPSSLTRLHRIVSVCDEFEAALLAGRDAAIEPLLETIPEADRPRALRELLALELEHRRARDEDPTEHEYRRRFPAAGSVIAELLTPNPGPAKTVLGQLDETTVHRSGEDAAAADDPPPTRGACRFRIVQAHARGGLGEVFVAIDTELNREVALKEIRAEHADDAESRGRFLVEAEVTGRLEHPGIVPVYSLDRRADGRPYYAMRFIRGESLKEAIERFHAGSPADPTTRALELAGLLRRFLGVCHALDYAHSRDVVHRDLKPANIMLGDFGETLVVDWGLAKPLGEPEPGGATPPVASETPSGTNASTGPIVPRMLADESTTPTRTGQVIGTPAYMSPEQAAGGEIAPASDIYSLGATLYSILTGRAPVQGEGVLEVLDRVRRGVIDPPSASQPKVDRALEAVCLKALALRPEDRYASARALAADIELWLADEPVSAHREPFSIRLGRWARRNRALVTGVVSLLGTAVVALAIALVVINGERAKVIDQSRLRGIALKEARASKERADEATTEAKAESAKVVGVINVLVNTFRSSDPIAVSGLGLRSGSEDGRKLTAVDILDRSAKSVVEGLRDQPLVQATLMDNIGDVYRSMHAIDKAEPLLKAAHATRVRLLERDSPDVATSLLHLGCLNMDSGKFAQADTMMRESLAIRSRLSGPDGLEACEVRFYLALLNLFEGNNQAEDEYRALVEARRRLLPDNHRDVALARIGLATALMQNKKLPEAYLQGRWALNSLFNQADAERIAVAIDRFQKAYALFHVLHMHKAAERLYNEGLELTRATLGPENPYSGFFLYELGSLKESQKRFPEAEADYRAGLKLLKDSAGLRHPKARDGVKILADLLDRTGRHAEGKALFDELIAARKLAYGPVHPFVADCLVDLSNYVSDGGDRPEALRLAREALGMYRANRHDQFGFNLEAGLNNLADLLNREKDYKEAETLLREALPRTRERYGEKDRNVGIVLTNLVDSLLGQGRADSETEAIVDEAREILCASSIPDGFHTDALLDSMRFQELRGQLDRAEEFGAAALKAARAAFRDDPAEQAYYAASLADLLARKKSFKESEARFREALALARKADPPVPRAVVSHENSLILLLALRGDEPGLREAIARLLRDDALTRVPDLAGRVAWAAVRSQGSTADPAQALRLAERAVAALPRNTRHLRTLALARSRAGQTVEAAAILEDVRKRRDGQVDVYDELLRAIIERNTGRAEAAQAALKRGIARLEGPDGSTLTWEQRTELTLLRKEAEAEAPIEPRR